MSVLKSKRKESATEYVNLADEIYAYTLAFCTKLSNRYQRLIGRDTMAIASKIIDEAEGANSVRIIDRTTYEVRRKHLLEARAGVKALDVHMYYIWKTISTNPQGCFTNTKGETKTPAEALKILDTMAENLGCMIDEASNKISKVLESDKKKFEKG